ncbi:MAG: tRNA uridine-5-carboxymethylaminomethyl(34) synthesis enzyme MnmG, partial [Bacilli bacterium]|nr:tRNA uridine-5-carboxymethylaminomethyl(34) synthesis enzyme MnmG [Bacilli bacterium]
MNNTMNYDVIVVGGGHAGSEASYACATMGMKTLLLCLNEKMISNMPCNPHIGGSAKGIVVREIDALGGIMGKVADMKGSLIQIKELNTSKGPGVRCLRAQEDKIGYPRNMQAYLKTVKNLTIQEGECKSILAENHKAYGIELEDGTKITAKAIILATGTHMEARILRGHKIQDQGPDGEKASHGLSKSLQDLGLKMLRLKTGTPPRLDPKSIDYQDLQVELGGSGNLAFSYDTKEFMRQEDMLPCHLTYTNEKTHEIIRAHLQESAMYGGVVEGGGPRYCPSIEDKVVRFASKERHQLFLEPESVFF